MSVGPVGLEAVVTIGTHRDKDDLSRAHNSFAAKIQTSRVKPYEPSTKSFWLKKIYHLQRLRLKVMKQERDAITFHSNEPNTTLVKIEEQLSTFAGGESQERVQAIKDLAYVMDQLNCRRQLWEFWKGSDVLDRPYSAFYASSQPLDPPPSLTLQDSVSWLERKQSELEKILSSGE